MHYKYPKTRQNGKITSERFPPGLQTNHAKVRKSEQLLSILSDIAKRGDSGLAVNIKWAPRYGKLHEELIKKKWISMRRVLHTKNVRRTTLFITEKGKKVLEEL